MTDPIVLAPNLALPIEAVTETFGILGIKGSGKSTTAKLLVEQLTRAGQQCVIVDPLAVWWGLKSSRDGTSEGLPFTVLGGDHADVPITSEVGQVVADLATDDAAPLIIDLSRMRKAEQRRFMTSFVEQLYHRNRQPLHLVIDECDLYIHQRQIKGEERLVGAMEDLVRRGRVKGIGVTLISQRPASVHKDVLSQVSVLVAHRLVGPQDRAALDSWVQAHGDRDRRDQMMANLAGLPAGTAWFWSPSWLDFFGQVAVNLPSTFDSMATPKAGAKPLAPKVLAAVDIDALRERLASIVEQAEADDPNALKRRIAELQRQLAHAGKPLPAKVEVVERVVEVERVPAALLAQLRSLHAVIGDLLGADGLSAVPATPARAPRHAPAPSAPRPARQAAPAAAGGVPGPQRKLLAVLATYGPRSKRQLAMQAGYSENGGGFNNPLGALRSAGWVEGGKGAAIAITDEGLAALGPFDPLPTGPELLEHWRAQLPGPAVRILDQIIAAHPRVLSKDELAAAAGYSPVGGGFNNPLGRLRTLGLVVGTGLGDEFAEAIGAT